MLPRGAYFLVLALFGGVLVIGALAVAWLDHRSTLLDAKQVTRGAALAYAQLTRQNLAELRLGMDWLARQIDPTAPNLGLTQESVATAKLIAEQLPGLSALVFIDRKGVLRFSTASLKALGQNMSDRDYFKAARDHRQKYYLGPTVRARGTRRLVHTYSRRIEQDGEFAGVVIASVRATQWSAVLRPLLRRTGSRIRLIRRDGTVVLNQFREGAAGKLRALTGEALQQDIRSRAQLISASAPVEGFDLTVEASVPRTVAMAPWRERLTVVILTGVLGLGALIAFGAFGFLALRDEARTAQIIRDRNQALESRTAELNQAAETQKLLMGELEHRVHNSLTLAASMLSLQKSTMSSTQSRDALENARARILAIAKVHNHLKGDDNPTSTRLGEYLGQLCDALATNATVEYRIHADPVTLPTRTVVRIGLILTELVLNAAKYAGDRARRQIDVTLSDHTDQITLEVRDYGPGLADDFLPEASSGLGMQVVTTMIDELGGTFRWGNADPGARFIISLPKNETEEDP